MEKLQVDPDLPDIRTNEFVKRVSDFIEAAESTPHPDNSADEHTSIKE